MIEKIPEQSNPENNLEITEAEAAELLQSEQEFSPEKQEQLISMIKDPNESMYILGYDDAHGRKLMPEQSEKLLGQALSDREVVEVFYVTLTESGVELNENEKIWLTRLQEVIDKN